MWLICRNVLVVVILYERKEIATTALNAITSGKKKETNGTV